MRSGADSFFFLFLGDLLLQSIPRAHLPQLDFYSWHLSAGHNEFISGKIRMWSNAKTRNDKRICNMLHSSDDHSTLTHDFKSGSLAQNIELDKEFLVFFACFCFLFWLSLFLCLRFCVFPTRCFCSPYGHCSPEALLLGLWGFRHGSLSHFPALPVQRIYSIANVILWWR